MTTHRIATDTRWSHDSGTGTLLGIWAHPDDEAYLSAGADVQRPRGRAIGLSSRPQPAVNMGTDDPAAWPPDRLAATREREMAASLAAVDVTEHHWLGYRDGTLAQVPDRQAVSADQPTASPRSEPDTDRDVRTGRHDRPPRPPDDVAAGRRRPGRPAGRRSRLWYATFTPEFHRTWGELNDEVGLWFEGSEPPSDPHRTSWPGRCDATASCSIASSPPWPRTRHQTSGLISTVGAERYRQWWSTEYFVDARTRLDRRSAA